MEESSGLSLYLNRDLYGCERERENQSSSDTPYCCVCSQVGVWSQVGCITMQRDDSLSLSLSVSPYTQYHVSLSFPLRIKLPNKILTCILHKTTAKILSQSTVLQERRGTWTNGRLTSQTLAQMWRHDTWYLDCPNLYTDPVSGQTFLLLLDITNLFIL